jgi:uncharacterized protein (DUF2235 family)
MARPPKNLVVFCDGTGNRYGLENSNVVKLYTCIEEKEEQSAYYHPGVGTMGDPRKTSWAGKKISLIKGLAFGSGFIENLADAYRYLMGQYAEGDHIYLFGFSRGAYTVRALAGALYMYGLLCPGNEGHLAYLLDMFSDESHAAFGRDYAGKEVKAYCESTESKAFRDTFSRVVPIHFMGVWDTVSSLGFSNPIRLLFDGQNPVVRRIRHAISVDERRCFFQANLLGKPLNPSETPVIVEKYPASVYPEVANRTQNIVQAWFAGVHSDVGGSYPQDECAPAMDALKWMFEEAVADGLIPHEGKRKSIFGEHPSGHEDLDKMNIPPKANYKLHSSLTLGWMPLEAFPHEYFDQNGVRRWRLTPWPHSRELPEGSLIHPSLRRRFVTDPSYKPKNLLLGDIEDFDGTCDAIPQPEVLKQLQREGYGVYKSKTVAKPLQVRAATGAAAAVIVGAAAWLLRR